MPRTLTTLLVFAAAAAACVSPARAAPEVPDAAGGLTSWVTITNARSQSELAYPANVFTRSAGRPQAEGQVLLSPNGNARLLVGSFLNESATSLSDYRSQLLQDNYHGAQLDYAPSGKGWFVISGTLGAMMFYERVSFTCDGRFINSWAMLYPVAERRFYDRVVEAIAPTFHPGRGATGRCE